MHELALAEGIAGVALAHAGGRPVRRVEVKVGHLRQVVPESLRFAFELLAAGTALDGAELAIERVPARVRCRECGAVSTQDGFPLACRGCGGLSVVVVSGQELLVDALELEEPLLIASDGRPHHGG